MEGGRESDQRGVADRHLGAIHPRVWEVLLHGRRGHLLPLHPILAWTLSPTQTGEVVIELLERAWEEAERLCGQLPEPIIVRTDNGGQYRSQALQDYLEAVEERFDHQRTAYRSPQEIAYIESFHGKLEVEEIYQREYGDPLEAGRSIGTWVEGYNTFRPHQGLNYRTPQEVYLEGAEE